MTRGSTKNNQTGSAVLLLGAGYGALKIAEDLAQSNVPVVWVTGSHHFLEMPGGISGFDEWPADLNYQFRPLYLRATRHPLINTFTGAKIDSISKNGAGNGYEVIVRKQPRFIEYDLCTGCLRCKEVCPLDETDHPPITRTPEYCPSRALELDKRKISPCRIACPLGVNVQAYMALAAVGRFEEALAVIREDNPLPGICGRICHHPCEAACRRGELDEEIAVRDIKRFLYDYESQNGSPHFTAKPAGRKGKKVAVVGSGPSGLTAAHFLNLAGYDVTILEALPEPGGMLRSGINAFRLSRDVLAAEIKAISDLGVKIKTNTKVDSIEKLLKKEFDAVLLATGTHQDLHLNIPGEDLEGVTHCVSFLSELNLNGRGTVGNNTVIIGGGNSSMDAARTALRLGADQVTVLAIEKEDEMPASPKEVEEAREEGIRFMLGFAPVRFEGKSSVEGIRYVPAHWEIDEKTGPRLIFESSDELTLEADTVIVAIGQKPNLEKFGLDSQVKIGPGGRIKINSKSKTSEKGVFAAGDVVSGPSTVIESMARGREAAGRIIEFLSRKRSPLNESSLEERGVGDHLEISEDELKLPRQEMSQRQPKVRRRDFNEVGSGLSFDQVLAEAKRCLQCGACCECRACQEVCDQVGAIDHDRLDDLFEFQSPAVIVADQDELPPDAEILDEHVFFTNNVNSASDLMDILVAGGAAAGRAMADVVQLRSESPDLSMQPSAFTESERLGFFLCACNQTMAPAEVLTGIKELADNVPGVMYSEIITSVCTPQGGNQIADSIRKNNLGKVVLASCICCPLEFQCITCNDQRSRAKIHLFDKLNLPRSRFETINLRDFLTNGEQTKKQLMDRAKDMLRAAFLRVNFMEPLRQDITEISKRVLVLGGSEIGISCAENLALQGFKVRLVHRATEARSALPAAIKKRKIPASLHHSINQVDEAEILGITGQLGDFSVKIRKGKNKKSWDTDIICLTDENLLGLAIPDDIDGLKKLYRYDFSLFHSPQMGLYRVMPKTLKRVTALEAGAALAGEVAATAAVAFLKDHQLSPRVDEERCRGCGRCVEICPFNAIQLVPRNKDMFTASLLRHNCVGCGGCVGRCPVTALDMPYFSNNYLDEIVIGTLTGDRLQENAENV